MALYREPMPLISVKDEEMEEEEEEEEEAEEEEEEERDMITRQVISVNIINVLPCSCQFISGI